MSKRIHIVHLIVRLQQGGAEQSLTRLVTRGPNQLEHTVICFGEATPLAREMTASGTVVHFVKLSLAGIRQAGKLITKLAPDVVQGWMYYGNLLASLLSGSVPVVWNIRSEYNSRHPLRIRLAVWLSDYLTPNWVIYNARAGQDSHTHFGRLPHSVIANGIDCQRFKPDAAHRAAFRATLGVDETVTVIALVTRYHPDKGVDEFLRLEPGPSAKLLMIGRGMTLENSLLKDLLKENNLLKEKEPHNSGSVILLGEQHQLERVYPGLDLLVVASYREGLPNVLLEAMACGVTVVGTDVGDVALVIDDPARVCPPRDAQALAEVVAYGLQHCGEFSQRDRQRVVHEYDSERCGSAYLQLYRQLADTKSVGKDS